MDDSIYTLDIIYIDIYSETETVMPTMIIYNIFLSRQGCTHMHANSIVCIYVHI